MRNGVSPALPRRRSTLVMVCQCPRALTQRSPRSGRFAHCRRRGLAQPPSRTEPGTRLRCGGAARSCQSTTETRRKKLTSSSGLERRHGTVGLKPPRTMPVGCSLPNSFDRPKLNYHQERCFVAAADFSLQNTAP